MPLTVTVLPLLAGASNRSKHREDLDVLGAGWEQLDTICRSNMAAAEGPIVRARVAMTASTVPLPANLNPLGGDENAWTAPSSMPRSRRARTVCTHHSGKVRGEETTDLRCNGARPEGCHMEIGEVRGVKHSGGTQRTAGTAPNERNTYHHDHSVGFQRDNQLRQVLHDKPPPSRRSPRTRGALTVQLQLQGQDELKEGPASWQEEVVHQAGRQLARGCCTQASREVCR